MSKTTKISGKPSVVFFGSGPVAANSLKLLAHHANIEAIITKPATVTEMAVVDAPIHAVSNRKELDALIANTAFKSTLAVLIDFGIIVSRDVIDSFSDGIINSHFSILPEWRGADPISFAILSGQSKTGVSLMLLDEGMDTGKILVTKSLPINPSDTTPSLTDKLVKLSDELLERYIPEYLNGEARPRQQSHPDRATYSRKLTKVDGLIDWNKPAEVIEREIRAFIEWPKSRSVLANKDVVITSGHVLEKTGVPGTVFVDGKTLGVYCGKDSLVIDTLKPAGKKEMTAVAFLAGYRHLLSE